MKKILAIMLSMVMVFSLAACGSLEFVKVEQSNGTDVVKEETTESSETTENTEVSETTESTEVSESTGSTEAEIVEVEEIIWPTRHSYLNNDSWYFYVTNEAGENITSRYNLITGEMTVSPNASKDVARLYKDSYINEDGTMVNARTDEVLLKLEEGQFFVVGEGWTEKGICFVMQTTATIDGNTYSIGTVNYKGEWISESMTEIDPGSETIGAISYLSNGLGFIGVGSNGYLYDYTTGSLTYIEGYLCSYYVVDNKIYFWSPVNVDNCMMIYDIETGESNVTSYKKSEINYIASDGLYTVFTGANVKVVRGTEIIAEYDVSKYHSTQVLTATEDNLCVAVESKDGVWFLCVLNPDGSEVFEPIQMGALYDVFDVAFFSGDKIVGWEDTYEKFLIYDMATEETVEKEDFSIVHYHEETSSIIVYGEHPKYGRGVYLIDVNDMDTLINPFDIVRN